MVGGLADAARRPLLSTKVRQRSGTRSIGREPACFNSLIYRRWDASRVTFSPHCRLCGPPVFAEKSHSPRWHPLCDISIIRPHRITPYCLVNLPFG